VEVSLHFLFATCDVERFRYIGERFRYIGERFRYIVIVGYHTIWMRSVGCLDIVIISLANSFSLFVGVLAIIFLEILL
jgi:hypothetical protein